GCLAPGPGAGPGGALGLGGPLAGLRRPRAGAYGPGMAGPLDQLAAELSLIPLARAAADAFGSRQLTGDEARRLSHGGRLPGGGAGPPGPGAAVPPDGPPIGPGAGENRAQPPVVGVRPPAPPPR